MLVKLVIISYFIYFLLVLLFYLSPCLHWSILCSCGALSCLFVVLEFLSWPVPMSSCHWFTLPGTWSTSESAVNKYLSSDMVPCSTFSICLVLLLFCQLMSRLSQWCSLAVSLCHCVPAVASHVHLTTLLYQSVLSNPCYSLILQLGPPSRSLTKCHYVTGHSKNLLIWVF